MWITNPTALSKIQLISITYSLKESSYCKLLFKSYRRALWSGRGGGRPVSEIDWLPNVYYHVFFVKKLCIQTSWVKRIHTRLIACFFSWNPKLYWDYTLLLGIFIPHAFPFKWKKWIVNKFLEQQNLSFNFFHNVCDNVSLFLHSIIIVFLLFTYINCF